MDNLQAILVSNGVNLSEEILKEQITQLGYDPSNLSDDQVGNLANALIKANTTLSTPANGKKGGKPAKASKRRQEMPTMGDAIAHASQVSSAEIAAFNSVLAQGADAYSTDEADKMLAIVRNVPKQTVSKFVAAALQEAADTETFRSTAEEFVKGAFRISSDIEAE